MRLYPSILVVSLALLESGSQASKVRGTAAVNPTTEAVSVADDQHGLSLLSTTNGEDRMFNNMVKMLKKNRPNVDNMPPDEIVKDELEKLIPSLGDSSSSARPPINFQGATSSTVRQSLQTLSDEQKIQLGVKCILDNSLEMLEEYVGASLRKGGETKIDAFFSALCNNLGDDVVTKVVMNVQKQSQETWEKLVPAQFRFWQRKEMYYDAVFKSLRRFKKDDGDEAEMVANIGLRVWMLDEFIKFENGNPDDKSLFYILLHEDFADDLVAFISKSKSGNYRSIMSASELDKRFIAINPYIAGYM